MRLIEVDHVVSRGKTGNPERRYRPREKEFLQTEGQDISLATWKAGENSEGNIVRFIETTSKPIETTVGLPHSRIAGANFCSGVEDDEQPLQLSNSVIHLSFKKIRGAYDPRDYEATVIQA